MVRNQSSGTAGSATRTPENHSRKQAETLVGGIERTSMLIDQKLLHVPAEVDFLEFILSDGRVSKPLVKAEEKRRNRNS